MSVSLADPGVCDHFGRMTRVTSAVRQAVAAAPCSLRALARAAKVPHSTLVAILSGKREATAAVASAVAAGLEGWSLKCVVAATKVRRALKKEMDNASPH